jgi:hypothetical protein
METQLSQHPMGNAEKMNPSYSINKPCTEDWGKMTPEQQGRHCQVCCKTVVDFSQKTDSEIVDFLKTNSEKKVCGRFRSEQLVPPAGSRKTKQNRYRVFFAALIFVFGGMLFTSCSSSRPHNPEVMGDVAYVPEPEKHLMGDTIINSTPDTLKKNGATKIKCTKKDTVVEIPTYKMGDVAFDPNDTIR